MHETQSYLYCALSSRGAAFSADGAAAFLTLSEPYFRPFHHTPHVTLALSFRARTTLLNTSRKDEASICVLGSSIDSPQVTCQHSMPIAGNPDPL